MSKDSSDKHSIKKKEKLLKKGLQEVSNLSEEEREKKQ